MKELKCPICNGSLIKINDDEDGVMFKCEPCDEYFDEKDIKDITEHQFFHWTYWLKLAEKYENVDFTKSEDREQFREDFKILSRLWFKHWIIKDVDFNRELAEMWCNIHTENHARESIGSIYRRARGYLEYASDRMYINRWLYIRLLLNYDIK